MKLPPHIYDLARRIAEKTAQPIDTVLLTHLEQSFNDPLVNLPDKERDELRALAYLSDEALWTIAREKMPQDKQDRMQVLMDKNNRGEISRKEYAELSQLVEQGRYLPGGVIKWNFSDTVPANLCRRDAIYRVH